MSVNPWFRYYHEALDDPKVQGLPGDLFKAWVNLMSLSCRLGGHLPHIEDIAFALRLSRSRAQSIYETLKAAGLIDEHDGVSEMHNWSGRQFKSDVSTDRVKRFRNGKKTVPGTTDGTPPDTDTDTDTEKKGGLDFVVEDEFEKLWTEYPNKDGKKASLRSFSASVKTVVDLERIQKALTNYKAHLSRHPQKPIKNGSTWFNNWQDWVDWQEPQVSHGPRQMPLKPIPVC
jgi:hypothetical protein